MSKMKTILVVEDIDSIRKAIVEVLSKNYNVYSAENYDKAVQILAHEAVDLLITDIRMPGRSGLELIEHVQKNYPNTLFTLITAYDINEYIRFAKEHQVWNIIPKYSSLDLNFIVVMVNKLFQKDIFGVEKYFPELEIIENKKPKKFKKVKNKQLVYTTIRSCEEREFYTSEISKFFAKEGAPSYVSQIIEELTSNAMIRAPKDGEGNYKFQTHEKETDKLTPNTSFELSPEDYFKIGYGIYKKMFIFVARDHYGTLTKEEILYRLDRQVTTDPKTKKPIGVEDSHGRGLYICREFSDQLIFNIHKNKMTEVIAIVESSNSKSFKGLSIFEVS